MCLTVLIWLIKIAAFVWVSGGIHLQPVHSLDCWVGEWSQEKNSYIFIYSYIYILNIIYCLLAFSTLFSSCPNNPISKSRKAGRNILHPYSSLFQNKECLKYCTWDFYILLVVWIKKIVNTAHDCSGKQMVSWLTTQFMVCNCLVVRKIVQWHLESV